MASQRRNRRKNNGKTSQESWKQVSQIESDLKENLLKDLSEIMGPPATRKSQRIRKLKKETPQWTCDIGSENEKSSEDEYAVSHESSTDGDDEDIDDDDVASILSDKLNSPPNYPQRRSTVKIRGKSGMKFTKAFCKPNSSNRLDVFPNGMEWTFQQIRQLETEFKTSHPHLLPDPKSFSESSEKFNFLKSPSFEIISENNKVVVDDCVLDGLCAVPVSKAQEELVFCVGGPVSTLSWCPRSTAMLRSKQYLAVSTNSGLHAPDRTYNEPSLIQLWDCGVLDVSGHDGFTPKVMMKMCVQDGPIWELKWCNVGGYSSGGDGLVRLGILAAACASGRVLIISVPDPKLNNQCLDGTTYNVTPNLTLIPCFNHSEEIESLFGQCLCIDWNIQSGGKWLAGGFSKGLVALWKIGQISSLLEQILPCGQNEVVACRTLTAHTQPIRSICWCPFDDNIFATAGDDSLIKIWNRQSIHSPVLQITTKIGSVTEMVWPMSWCGVAVSTDEVFARPSFSGVVYIDIMTQLQNPTNMIPFKSCCQSVSFSDWMNICVGVDCTGLAVMYFANFLNRGVNKTRSGKPEPRLISTSLSLNWISTEDESEENEKFRLTFCDSDFKNVAKIQQRPICANAKSLDKVPRAIVDEPFVRSANRVSWNPNFGSHTWYCTGFQCGLVRLQSVKAFHNSVRDVYEDLIKKFSCAT